MAQLKDLVVNGAGRVVGKMYASAFVGDGSGLTNLNAAPKYQYGTSDLTAGSSSLATGTLYFVYE